jgi:flagellin
MAIYVNTNVGSLNGQRNLNNTTSALATSIQRLSSGMRVNSSKDDAAGMAVSTGFTAEIRGNNQGIRNANDAISMAQTAEGAIGSIENNVQRLKEIAVQSSNGTLSDTQRSKLQLEVDQLTQENTRIVLNTKFNGHDLLSGSSGMTMQIGSEGDTAYQITFSAAGLDALSGNSAIGASITATGALDIQDTAKASAAIGAMSSALDTIMTARATMGAVQNRFETVIANLSSYVENLSSARSRITDTDFASETATMTRNQILQQSGTAMLSQANSAPQTAMSLLR